MPLGVQQPDATPATSTSPSAGWPTSGSTSRKRRWPSSTRSPRFRASAKSTRGFSFWRRSIWNARRTRSTRTCVSLPDQRQHVINDVVLKRGGYFTDRRENEVLVNDNFARKHGLHPGPVDSPDPQQPPRRAVHRRHGDLQRVRVPGQPRLDHARPGAVRRVLHQADVTPRKCSTWTAPATR